MCLNDNAEKAVSLFQDGFSCSQAVLSAFSNSYGLDESTALKISSPFGGGIGGCGNLCGAVSGALMVIGLAYGRIKADDFDAKEKCYQATNLFLKLFSEKHGSTICRELLGIDISTEDGKILAKEKNCSRVICDNLVRDTVLILQEIL